MPSLYSRVKIILRPRDVAISTEDRSLFHVGRWTFSLALEIAARDCGLAFPALGEQKADG